MKKRLLLSIILGFGPLQSAINAQSVSIVKDLYTDNMNGLDEWNNKAIEYKDMLLFPGRTLATGLELYAIKSGELVLIKDINPGEDDSDPSNFFLYKDKVYFTARNDANGVEIWSTDGTEAGTQLTIEVAAGAEPTVSHDRFMVAKNGKLYFSQDNKAYVSDGTTGGTSVISNLSYVNFNDPGVNVSPASTTYKNGVAFVNNNRGDATIYAHDGTTLTPLKTLQLEAFTRVYGLAEVSHGLLYALEDSFNDTLVGLFLIDKTTGLVSEVKTATNESYEVSRMLSFNGKALFKMYGNDGIFATDGTTAGTVKIAAGNFTLAQLETWPHAVVSDKIVFLAGEPSFFNFDFYISDGTPAGTSKLLTVEKPYYSHLTTHGTKVFWVAGITNGFEAEIWSADVATKTSELLYTFTEGSTTETNLSVLGVSGETLYLGGNLEDLGMEVYKLNGVTVGLDNTTLNKPALNLISLGSDHRYMVQSEFGAEIHNISQYDLNGVVQKVISVKSNEPFTLQNTASISIVHVHNTTQSATFKLLKK